MGKACVVLVLSLCLTLCAGDCPKLYGWVRSAGDWSGDVYGGQLWNSAEPRGLMALDEVDCNYKSDPISGFQVGKSYQWKVTTQNTWDLNFGCSGRNGPNCGFSTQTGTVRFIFNPNPNSLVLSVIDVYPSSSTSSSDSSSSSSTSSSTSSSSSSSSSSPSYSSSSSTSSSTTSFPPPPPAGSGRQVFAHFMIGNTYWYDQQHFQNDMAKAKSVGIDAFALNIGMDDWTWDRVRLAYQAAQAVGFQCFLSFDMSIVNNADFIINGVVTVSQYAAQYQYEGKLFVSTFGGAGLTLGYDSTDQAWGAIRSSLSDRGIQIVLAPNFAVDPNSIFDQYPCIDGALSWGAWPDPTAFYTSELTLPSGDNLYMNSAEECGKLYMAPVSAWFYTHLSYKNYLYDSDTLWFDRWQQVIHMKPHLIEILTMNDWGESSYIGDIDPDTRDMPDGSKDYVNGMDHTAWMDTLPYFIEYYKTGVAPQVSQDVVVYYYRPHLKNANAYADPFGLPAVNMQNTARSSMSISQVVNDAIFVITILREPATLQITSGGAQTTQNVPAGANIFQTGLNTGQQTVTLVRDGAQVCTSTGSISVNNNPSTYNFNAYVSGCKSN
eukprot:Phypoly_transcript_05125.p1 GENE.Phypoly_transcript_05125~~Phypoly_transcript_05125.p1  ORF type:complete len:604 (+),score=109.53 Phypoly_transcript_05125:158-1969(+)